MTKISPDQSADKSDDKSDEFPDKTAAKATKTSPKKSAMGNKSGNSLNFGFAFPTRQGGHPRFLSILAGVFVKNWRAFLTFFPGFLQPLLSTLLSTRCPPHFPATQGPVWEALFSTANCISLSPRSLSLGTVSPQPSEPVWEADAVRPWIKCARAPFTSRGSPI